MAKSHGATGSMDIPEARIRMDGGVSEGTPVVEVVDVSYRRGEAVILEGVNLTVRAGEHWALIGPNGAGKSTILGFCGAMMHPSSGIVRVLGEQLGRVELQKLRRTIGHVSPRHAVAAPRTIREIVLTGLTGSIDIPPRWQPTVEQTERADALITQLGLHGKAESRWPILSQGERGRTLIARALITEPRLLVLDEPSTGLDLAAREQLLETLDRLVDTQPALASILVTHHLEELPRSTSHAALVSNGKITAAGPIESVLTTERVSAAFEHPIAVENHEGRWSARAVYS